MAKARDLAALAGLAGMAYAMRNKGDKSDTDTGDETDRLKKRGTPEEPRRQMTDYMKKAPEDEKGSVQSDVLKTVTAPKTAPNDQASNQGVIAPKSSGKSAAKAVAPTPSDRREMESSMSRGTRPAVAKDPNYSNEGRNSVAPAKNPNYSNEGRSSTAPTIASKVGDAVKTAAKTAYSGVPTSEEAAANRQAAYDKVKSVGSSVADYVKNFETPAERRSREAKEASGMKRGGMVSKVSSASSRADGIASRGKTRGKIC